MNLDKLQVEESKLENRKDVIKSEFNHLKKITNSTDENCTKGSKLFNELNDMFNSDEDKSFYDSVTTELNNDTKYLFNELDNTEEQLNESIKQLDHELDNIYSERNKILLEEKRENNEY